LNGLSINPRIRVKKDKIQISMTTYQWLTGIAREKGRKGVRAWNHHLDRMIFLG
jgi:hypothetical protein